MRRYNDCNIPLLQWNIHPDRPKSVLPNGKRLHTYANLYFNARNAMMYKRKSSHRELCVVRVDKSVLTLPTAIVADQNAASSHVRFGGWIKGIGVLSERHRVRPILVLCQR